MKILTKIPNLAATLCMLLIISLFSFYAYSEENSAVLTEVHCMKSTSFDYENLEKELWRPVHQLMVDDGKKLWWGFFGVAYGDKSDCDFYTFDVYSADAFEYGPDFGNAIEKLYKSDFDAIWKHTYQSRRIVNSSLWLGLDKTTVTDFRYIKLNWMQVNEDDAERYISLEKTYFKPLYQNMVENGQLGGWYLLRLLQPEGSSVPYQFLTVDLYKKLGPLPVEGALKKVHPDISPENLYKKAMKSREMIASKILYLISSTQPANP